jgi:hypothetical protein
MHKRQIVRLLIVETHEADESPSGRENDLLLLKYGDIGGKILY